MEPQVNKYTGSDYTIELQEDSKPNHVKPFPILKFTNQEVDRVVEIGILKKINNSILVTPTFIITMINGTARFISDFRYETIKTKHFPISKIQDLLLKLEGLRYATSLDLAYGISYTLCPAISETMHNSITFGKI